MFAPSILTSLSPILRTTIYCTARAATQEPDFVCRVLRDKELDVAGKTKVINSVANIAFAGGAMSVSMNDLNTAADSIEGRVSMRNEAFTEYGVMREWDRGNDLWVDVIGGKQKYKSLSATGISKAGFDTNAYGLVMGYDRKFAGKSVILAPPSVITTVRLTPQATC